MVAAQAKVSPSRWRGGDAAMRRPYRPAHGRDGEARRRPRGSCPSPGRRESIRSAPARRVFRQVNFEGVPRRVHADLAPRRGTLVRPQTGTSARREGTGVVGTLKAQDQVTLRPVCRGRASNSGAAGVLVGGGRTMASLAVKFHSAEPKQDERLRRSHPFLAGPARFRRYDRAGFSDRWRTCLPMNPDSGLLTTISRTGG